MRLLATALIALASLAWTASPGEARSPADQAQSRTAQAGSQASRASAARAAAAPQRQAAPRQAAAQARPSARSATEARGARQTASRSSARGSGRQQAASANCRGRDCAARSRSVSWQGGLEPPTNAQAQGCPSGTMATLAHGHSDIVRCMPL